MPAGKMIAQLTNGSVGLALGGGAAKGIAHIGVLQAFEEEGIPVAYLSGTSIGALVAAYYAFGKSLDEIRQIGTALNFSKLLSFTLQKQGLFTTDDIEHMLIRDLGDVRIEDAKIPLAICATDLRSGHQKVFTEGSVAKAVCASVAVPGLFVPVQYEGMLLADGGLVENVPISLLHQLGAGIAIGVNLSHSDHYPEPEHVFDIVGSSIEICMDRLTDTQLEDADIVVPLNLTQFSRTNNDGKHEEMITIAYETTKNIIWKIRMRQNYIIVVRFCRLLASLNPIKIPGLLEFVYRKLKRGS